MRVLPLSGLLRINYPSQIYPDKSLYQYGAFNKNISSAGYGDLFLKENPISFKGMACSTAEFPIKRVYGLECPCCGQVMLTAKQVDSFSKRAGKATGEQLKKELLSYANYYKETERTIVNEITSAIDTCPPGADLKTFVSMFALRAKSELEKSQRDILAQMQEEAKLLPEEGKANIEAALAAAEEKIQISGKEKFFKRKKFIEMIENAKDKSKKPEQYDAVVNLANEMPSSATSKNAFYVKYARNRGNEEIARRLVIPSIVTTEHVKAQSKGGENNTANYIPMCGECNSKRGNMSYRDWFKIHPEMPSNLQKYIGYPNDIFGRAK